MDKKTAEKIFHDLFVWFFAMLIIFVGLEYCFAGFVISHLNLSWWFLATLVSGGIYLSFKSEK